MPAVPSNFSVSQTLTKALANPVAGIGSARELTAENIPDIDNATALSFSPIGNLNAPVSFTGQALISIPTPTAKTAESLASLTAPVSFTNEATGNISTPSAKTAENVPSLPTPTAYTANALDPEVPPFSRRNARILYDNLLQNSTVTVSSGSNGAFTLIPNTAQRWTFTGGAVRAITYTLPANVNIDSVAIASHNLQGADITIQYSSATTGAYTDLLPEFTQPSNNAIFKQVDTAVSVRRLQVVIDNITGDKYIGVVLAGIALQMQRPFFRGFTPPNLAVKTDFFSSNSESGNFIGSQIRRRMLTSKAEWKYLSDTWYRTYFVPFLEQAATKPFIFAWNIEQYPDDVAYCQNIVDIEPQYSGGRDLISVDIPLTGIL